MKKFFTLFGVTTALELNTQKFAQQPLTRVTDPDELAYAGYPQEDFSQNTYPCLFKIGNAFYDFTPFKLAQNVWPAYWANMTDPEPTLENNFTSSLEWSYQYEVGFCQQMMDADNATCNDPYFAIGSYFNGTQYYFDEDRAAQPPTDCTPYTGDTYKNIEATTISQDVDGETQTGVAITYTGGPACQFTGEPTSFTIKSWCNASVAILDTEYSGEAQGDPCNPYIEIQSSIGGCDLLSNSMIWEYIAYGEPYFGVAAIVGGFLLAFYGFKLLKPSICIAGFLSCTCVALLIFYAWHVSSIDELATFYYWMAGGAVAGILVGLLLARYVKVGAAILGGWGGFVVGLILNEAFMYQFEYVWVFWTTNVVAILVCALLTFKIFDHAMILSTSVLGAYGLARGVSCYAGHYYNEFTIIKLLKAGAIDQIDPYYWGYVGGFVAVSAIGAWYQYRCRPKPVPTHSYHHR